MTERMRSISYLLYGLFSAIVSKNTIKTPEVIFHNRKCARYGFLRHSYQRSICMLVFLLVIENRVVLCPSLLLFFAHAHIVLLTTQKSCQAEKKFHNTSSAANQRMRTIIAIS